MAMRLGGNGAKKTSYPDNSEMNVTPFVDVMLVLLIIFMVAAPLATVNVKVDLPPPTEDQEIIKKKEVNIFISLGISGKIVISDGTNEQETTLAELPGKMADISKGNKQTRVFIRADQEVIYNQVMEMMNLVQNEGYEKVGLVVEGIDES
jgi:biopolymer transport protein ExbD